ncbi:MAG: zinc ribbon domain-containing protein [Flexilinea sp.]
MKLCIACGMPMTKPDDYPLGDESKDYCVYCAKPDGSMQSYPEKVEGTTDFLIKTQGLDSQAALDAAIRILAKLPAWRDVQKESE